MQIEHTIIIGAGPCGLSCAIHLQQKNIQPLIIEKGCLVNTIYNFPTHQTFFSSSEHLEIGDFPFVTERHKPVRNEALTYYREVTKRKKLRVQQYEEVQSLIKKEDFYIVQTITNSGEEKNYQAKHVVVATGYYDVSTKMNVKGEDLQKVSHYFNEAHPYFEQNVVVIGGKNSAVDATLELAKAGANVTVLYRGDRYSKSIKPWILPQFDSLIRYGKVQMKFNANVTEITNEYVYYNINGEQKQIENDFVFAMTGYEPNVKFLEKIGIKIDKTTGRPQYNETTYETNLHNVYVAGVVVSGFNTSETFIENGRLHGQQIAKAIHANIDDLVTCMKG